MMQWTQYLLKSPPTPLLMTVMAAFAWALFIYKASRVKKKARGLKLGRDGERAVAECLDTLREDGYRLLHDVVGGSFNLDHVLIGPAGRVYRRDQNGQQTKQGRRAGTGRGRDH